MRFLCRFIGVFIAAGAFVAVVIDGAKSIADNALRTQAVGEVWAFLSPSTLAAAQHALQQNFNPLLWDRVVRPLLEAPLFLLLIMVAAFFLLLGRRPRSRIGYAMRG